MGLEIISTDPDRPGIFAILVGKQLSSWFEGRARLHLDGPLTSIGGIFLRAVGMCGLVGAWWLLAGAQIYALFTG